MTEKTCSKCRTAKLISDFHSQPSGKHGVHSYCKPCANAVQKRSRDEKPRIYAAEQKRRWQIKGRYGLTVEQADAMLAEQGGFCAICRKPPAPACIDHCHTTGKVRGILCHRCNIRLSAIDDLAYRTAAIAYVERFA